MFFLLSYKQHPPLAQERLMRNETSVHADHPLEIRIVRLLAQAVEQSGKPIAEIARVAGMKRDTVRRSLAGDRNATLSEAVMILDAAGLTGEQALFLMLVAGDEFSLAWAGGTLAEFLENLFRRVPGEICDQLGDNVHELRPRWAAGTAALLVRTLAQHVAELARRGDAIGERQTLVQS